MSDKRFGAVEAKLFGMTWEEQKLQNESLREERAARARAFHAEAYRTMPSDLREQARMWGLSAFIEVVWMNAWENGYKQAVRDAETLQEVRENG